MHVYFSGVGGVGIGPLAMLAVDAGYEVSGSDQQQTEMVSFLRDRGARIQIGQDGSQIATEHIAKPIEWFVYSSALPADHPELKFARENGIKTSKRAEFLNQLLYEKDLRLVAVSGTHGKTTTTGLLIWLFQQLKIPVSYSIGTSLNFGPPAQYQADSEYFIYECDEFDRNFLEFKPYMSIIPSVDYDHPDTYPTQEDYNYAFNDFIAGSRHTLLWQEAANHLTVSDVPNNTILSEVDPARKVITLAGEHYRKNGWLAIQALRQLFPSHSLTELITAINKFPGTNRRFEKLADNIYSDYAHHPVEIAAMVSLAKEVNPSVVIVYQPHQNIRQTEIMNEGGYKAAFAGAKKVYWLPTYLSREYQDLPTLAPTELIASLNDSSVAEEAKLDDALWQNIKTHQAAGDLVLIMSAGDLDHWIREKLASK